MAPEDSDVRNPRRVVGQAAAIITIIYLKIRALNKNTNIPIIVVAVVGLWREDQNFMYSEKGPTCRSGRRASPGLWARILR